MILNLLAGLKARLLPVLAGVLAVALAASAFLYWRLDAVKEQRDEAKAALKQIGKNEKVVTEYVEIIKEVPGPTVIRDRLVGRVCHVIDVPGPGDAAAAPAPDAVAGRAGSAGEEAERAAESIRNHALNKAQCEALLKVVRPQANRR